MYHVCMYVHKYQCMYVCMYIRVYICICMCACVCIYGYLLSKLRAELYKLDAQTKPTARVCTEEQ
jgi:hypothetical protein